MSPVGGGAKEFMGTDGKHAECIGSIGNGREMQSKNGCIFASSKRERSAHRGGRKPRRPTPLPADPSSTKHPTKDRAEEAETKALWQY